MALISPAPRSRLAFRSVGALSRLQCWLGNCGHHVVIGGFDGAEPRRRYCSVSTNSNTRSTSASVTGAPSPLTRTVGVKRTPDSVAAR